MNGEEEVPVSPTTKLREAGFAGAALSVEFRELRYFVALCEELHFGRAAQRLHISQSPLSQTIAQFERKLGTRLVERSSRRVELTPAGVVLLEHARRMLGELDDAIGATQRAGAGELGRLRIAVGRTAREPVLPALLHELDKRFPDATIEIADGVGDLMLERLVHGASDAVVMLAPPSRDDIGVKPLRHDPPIAVVHRTHPLASKRSVSLNALREHPLVVTPRPIAKGTHDFILSLFGGSPPSSTRTVELNSGAFWVAMLAGGFSVAPASAALTGDFVGVPIADAESAFVFGLVWSRRTPPMLLDGLIEAADAAIETNGWH